MSYDIKVKDYESESYLCHVRKSIILRKKKNSSKNKQSQKQKFT